MDELSDADLRDRFLPRLRKTPVALRSASADRVGSRRRAEMARQSVGRSSRMNDLQQQAIPAAQDGCRQGRRRAIEAAICRIEAGGFGSDDSGGNLTGLKRLDLDPTIMRCRDCAG